MPNGKAHATTSSALIADFIDPTGALRKAGILEVVIVREHTNKNKKTQDPILYDGEPLQEVYFR